MKPKNTQNSDQPNNPRPSNNFWPRFWKAAPWVIGLAIVIIIIYFLFFNNNYKWMSWSDFMAALNNKDGIFSHATGNKQNSITIQIVNGILIVKGTYYSADGVAHQFTTSAIASAASGALQDALNGAAKGFFGSQSYISSTTNWLNIIFSLLPFLLFIIIAIFLYRYMAKQKGAGFAKKSEFTPLSTDKILFSNVAGYAEEKEELNEIIKYLKAPKNFQKMGIRVPRGVLLVGAPGTGKTYLAKAVAGEAKVPFFSVSASEFVELFVGVGASRIRELFKTARKKSPCIIFIDELDSVGRQRGAGMGGGNDEREQTLNQLLVELDGFSEHTGVIVISSTNRVDILDPALLRPGRFDRKITFHLPNLLERAAILKIHSNNKNVDSRISWLNIAKRTPGFSGAQLENILNEAALVALRFDREIITISDVDEAIDRVIGGPTKVSRVYKEKEKWTVSYHESGHALIGLKLADADEVQKITIIPRGNAGGYTMITPKDETFLMSKSELISKITGYLGGRASEEIMFGAENITSGASDDISKATTIARKMVTELGMSRLGIIKIEEDSSNPFLGKAAGIEHSSKISNETAHAIDQEVKYIIDQCYIKAIETINANKPLLDILAKSLYELEILTSEQIKYIVDHNDYPPEYKSQIKIEKKEETRIKKMGQKESYRPQAMKKTATGTATKSASTLKPTSLRSSNSSGSSRTTTNSTSPRTTKPNSTRTGSSLKNTTSSKLTKPGVKSTKVTTPAEIKKSKVTATKTQPSTPSKFSPKNILKNVKRSKDQDDKSKK